MQIQRNREEVVNTQLAILISRLGVTANAETIHVHLKHPPDVLFQLRGLRVVIEGKFADHPGAGDVVLEDARNRVQWNCAHSRGHRLHKHFAHDADDKILNVLGTAQLRYRIISEVGERRLV